MTPESTAQKGTFMIVCVSPNPAIDRTYIQPGYGAGGVFRPEQTVVAAGGKGVNVVRAVRILGGQAINAGFLAGHTGRLLDALATAEGLPSRWTWIDNAETRTCIIVADPERAQTTVLNERGPHAAASDWAALHRDVLALAESAASVCFCGSLPPTESTEPFTGLLRALIERGKAVWVDTSGAALAAAVQTPGVTIKVNDHEIGALLRQPVETVEQAGAAAAALSRQMCAPVAVTLGSRGAVFASDDAVYHAQPPKIKPVSAVGSGDVFLAGLLLGLDREHAPSEALRMGAAAGAANAMSAGGGQFSLAEYEQVFAATSVQTL